MSGTNIYTSVFTAAIFIIAKKWKWDHMNERGGHYAKRNKPVTKREIPHATTYRRYLKSSNS